MSNHIKLFKINTGVGYMYINLNHLVTFEVTSTNRYNDADECILKMSNGLLIKLGEYDSQRIERLLKLRVLDE